MAFDLLWELVTFESLLKEPLRNGIYKKKEFHGRGCKIINMGELFGHPRLKSSVEMKLVELTEKEKEKGLVQTGDLIFARRSLTAEGAGKCTLILSADENTTFESSIIRARLDSKIANSEYYYYLFNSPLGKWLLGTILRQTAVSGITGGDLAKLLVPKPPVHVQDKIVEHCRVLDDKIDTNNQTNQILEQMAQTLFKSWFVDFDPVFDNLLAKANNQLDNLPADFPEELHPKAVKRLAALSARIPTQAHENEILGSGHESDNTPLPHPDFPSEFEFNEQLGWVPLGWEVVTFESLITLIGGGTPKTSIEEYWNGDIPWFSVVDAPNDSDVFVIDTDKYVTQLGVDKSSTKILRAGTTIISARGTVGKCAFVGTPMAMNQSCYGINGINSISDEYIYFLTRHQVSDLQKRGHGSVFNTITRETFKSIQLPFSGEDLTIEFSLTVKPFFEKILNNNHQNIELTKLRDTLLPKLISGELQIPDDISIKENEA